jgi:hypothetical protein
MERTGRASYRRGEASDRASIEEELKRGGNFGSGNLRRDLRTKEEDDDVD